MEVIFDVSDMKDFAAFVLYYSANPKSTMCIPNAAYEQVDKLWKKWLEKKNGL